MADLAKTMSLMFTGGDMTIFQATVDAVGTGVVTVHADGGTFTDVPYLTGAFYPATGPSIGNPCYVIGREGWGHLVIGMPAPGPNRSSADSQTVNWAPHSIGIFNDATDTWTVPVTDDMPVTPGFSTSKMAVYFFSLADIVNPGALATSSFYLEFGAVDLGGDQVDWAYLTVGLHSSTGPTGVLQRMTNLNGTYRGPAIGGLSQFVSIPLDWVSRLLTGEAKGIYIQSEDYPLTISGPGTIRMTTL